MFYSFSCDGGGGGVSDSCLLRDQFDLVFFV